MRAWLKLSGWIAACAVVWAAWNWISGPDGARFGIWPLLIMAITGFVGAELPRSVVGRWIDGEPKPGVTVWKTSRATQLASFVASLSPIALAPDFARHALTWWPLGDWPRVFVSGLLVALALVLMLIRARKALRREPELWIDDQGVWSKGMETAVAWSDVAFAITPHSLDHDFRLRLRDAGLVRVTLAPAGLSPRQALEIMCLACPTLRVEPWTREGIVLPIRGGADVPDAGEIRTYG